VRTERPAPRRIVVAVDRSRQASIVTRPPITVLLPWVKWVTK